MQVNPVAFQECGEKGLPGTGDARALFNGDNGDEHAPQHQGHQQRQHQRYPGTVTQEAVAQEGDDIDQPDASHHLQQGLHPGSQPPSLLRGEVRDECLVGPLGGIGAQLEQAVNGEDSGVALHQPDAGNKDHGQDAADEDKRSAPTPPEAGAVADGTGDGLVGHGQQQPGEGQQAEVGVLLGLRHEIEQAQRQDNAVQAAPERRYRQAENGYLDVITAPEMGGASA